MLRCVCFLILRNICYDLLEGSFCFLLMHECYLFREPCNVLWFCHRIAGERIGTQVKFSGAVLDVEAKLQSLLFYSP